jgi:hypothetical protein
MEIYAAAGVGVVGAGMVPLLPFWMRASFQAAIMDLPAGVVPNWMMRASSSPNFFSIREKAGRKPLVRALRTAWAAPGALTMSAKSLRSLVREVTAAGVMPYLAASAAPGGDGGGVVDDELRLGEQLLVAQGFPGGFGQCDLAGLGFLLVIGEPLDQRL